MNTNFAYIAMIANFADTDPRGYIHTYIHTYIHVYIYAKPLSNPEKPVSARLMAAALRKCGP